MDMQTIKLNKKLLPSFIEIETTSFCNRRCPWCPNSRYPRGRQAEKINKTLFKKIILDLARSGFHGQIALHGYNEPLLDPEIFEHIKIVNSFLPDAKVLLFTNGDYLDKEVMEKISRLKIFQVIVSLHDAIFGNEYDGLLSASLRRIGIADAPKKDVSDVFGKKTSVSGNEMEIVYYAPDPSMLTSRGGIIKKFDKTDDRFCFLPFCSAAIDFEGNLKICCEIYPGDETHRKNGLVGNLEENDFSDLWFSEVMDKIRFSFIFNGEKNGICSLCRKNDNNIHSVDIDAWKNRLLKAQSEVKE